MLLDSGRRKPHNAARFQSTQLVSVESIGNGARLFANLRRVPQTKSRPGLCRLKEFMKFAALDLDCDSDIHADRVF